jgi:hypothetical protein
MSASNLVNSTSVFGYGTDRLKIMASLGRLARFYVFILVAYSLLAAVYLAWTVFLFPFCLHLRALKLEHGMTPMLVDTCLGAYVIVLFRLLHNSPGKSKQDRATTP